MLAIGSSLFAFGPDDDFQAEEFRQLFETIETEARLAFHQLTELRLIDAGCLADRVARFAVLENGFSDCLENTCHGTALLVLQSSIALLDYLSSNVGTKFSLAVATLRASIQV